MTVLQSRFYIFWKQFGLEDGNFKADEEDMHEIWDTYKSMLAEIAREKNDQGEIFQFSVFNSILAHKEGKCF